MLSQYKKWMPLWLKLVTTLPRSLNERCIAQVTISLNKNGPSNFYRVSVHSETSVGREEIEISFRPHLCTKP